MTHWPTEFEGRTRKVPPGLGARVSQFAGLRMDIYFQTIV